MNSPKKDPPKTMTTSQQLAIAVGRATTAPRRTGARATVPGPPRAARHGDEWCPGRKGMLSCDNVR